MKKQLCMRGVLKGGKYNQTALLQVPKPGLAAPAYAAKALDKT